LLDHARTQAHCPARKSNLDTEGSDLLGLAVLLSNYNDTMFLFVFSFYMRPMRDIAVI
jgi:hypothetical protein